MKRNKLIYKFTKNNNQKLNCQRVYLQLNDNKAEIYGNNIGTIPVDINIYSTQMIQNNFLFIKKLLNDLNNQNDYYGYLKIDEYQSGSSAVFGIEYIDVEGNKVQFSSDKIKSNEYPEVIINEITQWNIQIESLNVNLIQITGQSQANYIQFDFKTQSFIFNKIYINSNPNSQQNLIQKYQINNQLKRGEVKIDISFRPCIAGEIYKVFTNTIYICQECIDGYYSIKTPDINQPNLIECKKCPDQSAQVCGKDQIILKKGYWRESNSDNIYLCNEKINSCNENDQNNINGCVSGYVGPLCNQCDVTGYIWNKRFSKVDSSEQCVECSSSTIQYIVVLASALGLLKYIFAQILIFIRNFLIFQTCFYLRLSNMLPISASQMKIQNSFYIKCLINYLQLQSILANLQISYIPGGLLLIPNFFGKPSSQISINMMCIVSRQVLHSIGQGKTQIIILVIIPLIYIFTILMTFLIFQCLNLKRFQVKQSYKYTALNFIFIFFQSDSINSLANFLTCKEIGSKSYISNDMLYECNDPSYVLFQKFFVIPLLIFWILIPLIVYFFLRKRAKTLNYCSTIFKFGCYYLEYHSAKYYWEYIRIYFKVAIVILFALYNKNGLIAHFMIVVLIAIYVSFLQQKKPYINKKMMKFELLSYLSLILIMLIYNLLNVFSNKILGVLFLFIHYSFILYIAWTIAYDKLFTKRTFLGKVFIFIVQRLVIQKTLVKLTNKMDVKFKTFLLWKIVKKNINHLTNQKALKRLTSIIPNSKECNFQINILSLMHVLFIYQQILCQIVLENHHSLQNQKSSPKVSQVYSNFALSFLSQKQLLPQSSTVYSPKNSDFLRSNITEEKSKLDKINLFYSRVTQGSPDKNFTSDQVEEQNQLEDIDDNIEEQNINGDVKQQTEFRTMMQLSKQKIFQYRNLGFRMQLSPKNEIEYLNSPAQHRETDKILNSKNEYI